MVGTGAGCHTRGNVFFLITKRSFLGYTRYSLAQLFFFRIVRAWYIRVTRPCVAFAGDQAGPQGLDRDPHSGPAKAPV